MLVLETALRGRYADNGMALAALDRAVAVAEAEAEDADEEEEEEEEEEEDEEEEDEEEEEDDEEEEDNDEEEQEDDEEEQEDEEQEDEVEDEEEDEDEDEDNDKEDKNDEEEEEEDYSVAPDFRSIPIPRHLVERGVSARPSTSIPFISGPPSPTTESKTVFSTPWVGEKHFEDTDYYSNHMQVIFVELPCKYTNKDSAFARDAWMCTNLNLDKPWVKNMEKKFPKLVFSRGKNWTIWEWVSYDSLIPLNLP
jgi:hypothetical protein